MPKDVVFIAHCKTASQFNKKATCVTRMHPRVC